VFGGDDVLKRVSVWSGGEKSRLALVNLLLDPPNLLLMDEPTTHLDMSSIDALAYALDQYKGSLVFISHDVYFIRALANHVVHVNAGLLKHYPGGYQYYLDKTQAESDRAALTACLEGPRSNPQERAGGAGTSRERKEQKRLEAEMRNARSRERRAQQQVVHRLEKKIQELEQRQVELLTELEKQETYETPRRAMEVNRELVDLQEELARVTREWEAEATRLTEMDQ